MIKKVNPPGISNHVNIYVHIYAYRTSSRTPVYMKQKLTELKEEIAIIFGDFHAPLSIMGRTTWKINRQKRLEQY